MTEAVNATALADLPRYPGPPRYGPRFLEALVVAAAMHAAQERKGTQIPYASHLLGTCAIALDYGASEDEAIAALLHDAVEDIEPTEAARAVVASFGDEVRRIVEGCTKPEIDLPNDSLASKRAYIRHIPEADASILLVSCADKLHNARSIVADLRRQGTSMFDRFNVGPDDTRAYYRSLVAAFTANPAHRPDLVAELDRVVTDMELLAGVAGKPDLGIDTERPAAPREADEIAWPTRAELDLLVEEAVKGFLGVPAIVRDRNGDIPVRIGSALVIVRTYEGTPPAVQVFSQIARGVEASQTFLETLNQLNSKVMFGRLLWVAGRVFVANELSAVDISAERVEAACHRIGMLVDLVGATLRSQFGGANPPGEAGDLIN
jgi:GTP pyrophosphokinase